MSLNKTKLTQYIKKEIKKLKRRSDAGRGLGWEWGDVVLYERLLQLIAEGKFDKVKKNKPAVKLYKNNRRTNQSYATTLTPSWGATGRGDTYDPRNVDPRELEYWGNDRR